MKTVPKCRSPFNRPSPLHVLQNLLLELALNLLALLVRGRLAVEGQETAEVELGLLEQLHLADVHLLSVSFLLWAVALGHRVRRTFWRG